MLYQTFKTNKNHEADGVWLEYGENSRKEPVRIKIARSGGRNEDFTKALEHSTSPYRKAISSGAMDKKLAEKIYTEVFLVHCVKSWEGVEDENGNPLPFTVENVRRVLTDLPDLYADLREQSSNLALFREELREADLGNSGSALSTDGNKAQ